MNLRIFDLPIPPFHVGNEFISFRLFSEILGGPARYVHFLEPDIACGDLLRTYMLKTYTLSEADT